MLKVTSTLGPSSSSETVILALAEVSDRFRLNASHLTPTALGEWLEKISRLLGARKVPFPVVVDLQGAKMRIGAFPECPSLPDQVTLTLASSSSSPSIVPVPHELFFRSIRPGDEITLNDARVRLRILSTQEDRADARVEKSGPLSSHKGINRSVHPIPFERMTDSDLASIRVSSSYPAIEYAFSFVNTGAEAAAARQVTGTKRLIAKIERPEAFPHLQSIDSAFDELWLCRGDLGAQAGLVRLGPLQEEFMSGSLARPRFLAGQVLEHLTHFSEPTRSEVVHLYDVERKGFSGIVLSDETAIGKNPLAVARVLATLLPR